MFPMTMSLVVFPAKDLDATKKLFSTLLGSDPYVDQPYYVGYRVGELEFGLDPHAASSGPICYWQVDDIAAAVQELVDAGAEVVQAPHDVGGGLQVATLKDATGSTVGFRQTP
jgi:predicted enzyme related to lactoylglutathione lyase